MNRRQLLYSLTSLSAAHLTAPRLFALEPNGRTSSERGRDQPDSKDATHSRYEPLRVGLVGVVGAGVYWQYRIAQQLDYGYYAWPRRSSACCNIRSLPFPLGCGVGATLGTGWRNPNLEEVIVVTPDHGLVAHRVNLLLDYRRRIVATGYAPKDLSKSTDYTIEPFGHVRNSCRSDQTPRPSQAFS
jgi:hypothetical protein